MQPMITSPDSTIKVSALRHNDRSLTRPPITLRAIGHTAHNALVASAGALDTLADFTAASYARANGEIIWIGHGDIVMHSRMVVLQQAQRVPVGDRLDAGALIPWHPPTLPCGARVPAALRSGCADLARNLVRLAPAKGFARMLLGGVPEFPLDRAMPFVHAFARALGTGDTACVDTARVYDAALPLLGLGPGLTPAGDDLVGAALFARRMMAASSGEVDAWARLAVRLIDAAHTRNHPIAAALFRDLVMVESFAPLHRLAAALASGAGDDAALDAARALITIGHSSGWEMLAGFIIGVTGMVMPGAMRGKAALAEPLFQRTEFGDERMTTSLLRAHNRFQW